LLLLKYITIAKLQDAVLGYRFTYRTCYRSILEIRPQQKAIIVSSFSESDRVKTAEGLGAGAYVRKPYIKEKLGLAVRKELDRPA
jgi:DNA-binding NarL/FixJ family response regulator